jgi:competence ComEA-like helix-hairpin-helix protein
MRAARLQILPDLLLAYVKQNLPTVELSRELIAFLVVAIFVYVSGCATLPHHHTPTAQAELAAPKSENGPRTNINTASPQQLEKLPGIGKVIADRIVAHRTQYGPFRRTEHLMMVRGISDRKFRALQSMIVVE